jgi:hypothetical protein
MAKGTVDIVGTHALLAKLQFRTLDYWSLTKNSTGVQHKNTPQVDAHGHSRADADGNR